MDHTIWLMDMEEYGYRVFLHGWIWMDMDFTNLVHVNLYFLSSGNNRQFLSRAVSVNVLHELAECSKVIGLLVAG